MFRTVYCVRDRRRRRSRAPRPDTSRVRYRIRRMWTLWTIPNNAKYVIRLDPPYDTNGIGKPGDRHDAERHPDVLEQLPEQHREHAGAQVGAEQVA